VSNAAPSRAIAYHDHLAKDWSERYAGGGFKRRVEFFAAEILPIIACQGSWIDVGCGSGVFTRLLARGGANVLGVDGSAAMIEAARAAPREAGAPPRYEVQTIETLGAENADRDGALCLSVLEYLNDPAAAVSSLARALRPGGALILSVPNRYSALRLAQSGLRRGANWVGAEAFSYLATSRNAWSRGELIALANAAGLACEAIKGFEPILPRPLARIAPPSLWFLVCRKPGLR
jgi:2-polyprenyl-3-methyl-5-hydroxy-6-metoxy-1,4-benzoquinol methylase